MSGPRLATIPPGAAFLDTLARRWLATYPEDPAAGLILLPTRRAARALAEAFLRAGDGRAMLLPRITALGAIDEAPLALAGAIDLPPPVPPLLRLGALARLVMALPQDQGGVRAADRGWALAQELATLMDEAERAEVPLAEALGRACGQTWAEHWEITLRFLRIVTDAWPAWLAEQGFLNPVARQVALLDAQARAWDAAAPPGAVWVAGTTGAIPAVARLLRVVAGLPRGLVVLPWFDASLEGHALPPTHPQAALHGLLASLGARAAEVAVWDGDARVPAARADLLAEALLPAALLHRWRAADAAPPAGLWHLPAADPLEEAVAIALILRDSLDVPGQRAALVTPDRALAARVSAELLRWGVVADDSAGEALAETPPALFLRLLARAVAEDLAPVPLLALLKHPFAAAGLGPASCRRAARALDKGLRGPRPGPGFAGLRRRLERGQGPHPGPLPQGEGEEEGPLPVGEGWVRALVERLRQSIEPLLRLTPPGRYPPRALLTALIEAAEALATTDSEPGAERLWRAEDGAALATLLAEALPALDQVPPQPPVVLPGLLDALLAGARVRSRRALRGRDAIAEHPRVAIWGLLEARLQAADVIVLGGLTEGTWPPATDPGPWMGRPMREAAGLPSGDEAIGLAAHDFVSAACCAPVAILSAPARRDGAPCVPARWLTRLEARLGARLPVHPALAWARALDQPADGHGQACAPPLPRPPAHLRPRRFRVTEIETLIADPYAIYARHVLRLPVLDPLDQETDQLDYGTLVHAGIERFLSRHAQAWPADPAPGLREAMLQVLADLPVRPALRAWWEPRLLRIADWIAAEEQRRRVTLGAPAALHAEVSGQWTLPSGHELRARADRIEARGGALAILDYKTGKPPGRRALQAGTKPQLLLEAAMAEAGAFPGVGGTVTELTYWHLSGGHLPGRAETPLEKPDELADLVGDTPGHVARLLREFDEPSRAYPHRPHPGRTGRDDYAQLARAGELAAAAEDDEA